MHRYIEPVTLVCYKIQAFSNNEILSLIPPETLSQIKSKDPHPYFQAYSICHEGISTPSIIGDTSKPIHWTRRAVQSLKSIILKGVKFFKGHNADNSTTGRQVLGEVVANVEQEINGVLHHVVVSYHSPEVKEEVKKYDICSQEAIWNLFDQAGQVIADTVDKITGIALGSSDTEQPAFTGARRLASVQAFTQGEDMDDFTKAGSNTLLDADIDQDIYNPGLLSRKKISEEDYNDPRNNPLLTEKQE